MDGWIKKAGQCLGGISKTGQMVGVCGVRAGGVNCSTKKKLKMKMKKKKKKEEEEEEEVDCQLAYNTIEGCRRIGAFCILLLSVITITTPHPPRERHLHRTGDLLLQKSQADGINFY